MYFPLFKSKVLMTYCAAITFLITPYFLFVGMSSLLYIEALGVPLEHFGYYQGAIAGIFAIFSLSSPRILAVFGQRRCLIFGTATTLIAGIMVLILAILQEHNPIIITISMMIMATGAIFPINILYPHALHVLEGAKSRISALIMAVRLIMVSVALGIVSSVYDHTFTPIGVGIAGFIALAVVFMYVLLAKRWGLIDN